MADELESRIDALYALPLERFTPERDALAKELAADGDRAGTARVKAKDYGAFRAFLGRVDQAFARKIFLKRAQGQSARR